MLATHKGGYYNGSFSWYAAHKDPSYFFEKVYDIFSADDFTIVNLENVLTDRKLAEVNKGVPRAFWFKGPASNANRKYPSPNHGGAYPGGQRGTLEWRFCAL